MARPTYRTLNLYSMHARVGEIPLDYVAFFQRVADLPPPATVVEVARNLNFALSGARVENGVFFARVIAGTPGELPTFFDYRTGELHSGATPTGQWLARTSRVVIDPAGDKRMVALEMSRSGVSSTLLERYFSHIGKSIFDQRVRFDFPPIPSPSLLDEIVDLSRIREAAVSATRPNFDWNDTKDDLADLASRSDGEEAEAVVRAGRGRSLRKESGIVRLILDSLRRPTPNVTDFRVVGTPKGADKPITISAKRHQRRAFVSLDPRAPLTASDDALLETAETLMDETSASVEALAREGRTDAQPE